MCGGPVAWRLGTCLPRTWEGQARALKILRAQNPHRSEVRTVGRGLRGAHRRCGNFWAVTRRGPLPEAGGERTPQAATQGSYKWLLSGTTC